MMYGDVDHEVQRTNELLEEIERVSQEQLEAALRLERIAKALAIGSAAVVIPTLLAIVWWVLL